MGATSGTGSVSESAAAAPAGVGDAAPHDRTNRGAPPSGSVGSIGSGDGEDTTTVAPGAACDAGFVSHLP